MNIENLLEELDDAEFHYEESSVCQPTSISEESQNKASSKDNESAIENIDSLLEDLDNSIFDMFSSSIPISAECKEESEPKSLRDEIDKDIEATKKETNLKYSRYGYEIHKKLKESQSSHSNGSRYSETRNSWTSKKAPEKSSQLSVSTSVVSGKVDVYAEPIFGLRLINPLVSSQFIQSKMTGKQPVGVENIAYHLRSGDRNTDWVFAGAVVFKSGLKTSQKGSQYCTWKISDLKGDLQTVSLYLFSKACSELWKIAIGTVVAILNAAPFNKDEQVSKDDLTLTVRSADQVMIWGGSRDYGICKAKKKNGENCTSFVNKSACEFCLYHVKAEYNKFSSRRSDLQMPGGMNGLRNKVLGKNEVFYAGKSYSALKAPPRDNKVRKRDNHLMNKLQLQLPKKSALLNQFDSQKIETSKKQMHEAIDVGHETKNIQTIPNKLPKPNEIQSSAEISKKDFTCRLDMLKQAGQRMIETGETTQVRLVKPVKKGGLSFATVFNSSQSETPSATELESRVKKVNVKDGKDQSSRVSRRPLAHSDFELHIEPALPGSRSKQIDITLESRKQCPLSNSKSKQTTIVKESMESSSGNTELNIESPSSGRIAKFNYDVEAPLRSPSTSTITRSTAQESSSTLLGKFKNLADTIKSSASNKENREKMPPPLSSKEVAEYRAVPPKNNEGSSPPEVRGSTPASMNLLRSRTSTTSANIHENRKNINKMRAVNLIRNKGGLTKSNPNQVQPDIEKKRSLKRRLEQEEENEEEKQSVDKKSVLSQRFIDLMNARSKHEDLVDMAEAIEQQNYFNKLEKKEQLEEKMLSTYKVPCKAVTCLKCKYKWFSASDLCRTDGHPIKVIETYKRFFKCDNCSNRTVSLEIIPLTNCRNCGSGKWSRAPMIRDKTVKPERHMCIRGDEQKNLNSLSGSLNLNLLVPE